MSLGVGGECGCSARFGFDIADSGSEGGWKLGATKNGETRQ